MRSTGPGGRRAGVVWGATLAPPLSSFFTQQPVPSVVYQLINMVLLVMKMNEIQETATPGPKKKMDDMPSLKTSMIMDNG